MAFANATLGQIIYFILFCFNLAIVAFHKHYYRSIPYSGSYKTLL